MKRPGTRIRTLHGGTLATENTSTGPCQPRRVDWRRLAINKMGTTKRCSKSGPALTNSITQERGGAPLTIHVRSESDRHESVTLVKRRDGFRCTIVS